MDHENWYVLPVSGPGLILSINSIECHKNKCVTKTEMSRGQGMTERQGCCMNRAVMGVGMSHGQRCHGDRNGRDRGVTKTEMS